MHVQIGSALMPAVFLTAVPVRAQDATLVGTDAEEMNAW